MTTILRARDFEKPLYYVLSITYW